MKKLMPHISIVLSGMMIVFFFIDKVNPAMAFINNDITKALLLILSIVSIVNAVSLLTGLRRLEAAKLKRKRQQIEAKRRTQKP